MAKKMLCGFSIIAICLLLLSGCSGVAFDQITDKDDLITVI